MRGLLQIAVLGALQDLKTQVTTNDIHEKLGGHYSIPSIFVTLDRLAKQKFVEIKKGDPLPKPGGKARLIYSLTPSGRAALFQARDELQRNVAVALPASLKPI